jgi:sugar/nucleoside kinase (ribokinase family)
VEGCIIVSDDEIFKSPARRVEIIDTAGDSFDSVFIVGVLENMPYRE